MLVSDDLQPLASFCRELWIRKFTFAACVLTAAAAGFLYHAASPPLFESTAELVFHRDSSAIPLQQMSERHINSAAVLEEAVTGLPDEYRKSFELSASETWLPDVRDSLDVKTSSEGQTQIVRLSYRSHDRELAAEMLRQIVTSYREYVESLHSREVQRQRDALPRRQQLADGDEDVQNRLAEQITELQREMREAALHASSLVDEEESGSSRQSRLKAQAGHGSSINRVETLFRNWFGNNGEDHLRTLRKRMEIRRFLVNSLKQIKNNLRSEIPDKPVPPRIEVTQHPLPASAPISAPLTSTLWLSVMFGTVVGMVTVNLLERIDTRFRTPREIEAVTHAPVLASVPESKVIPPHGNGFEAASPAEFEELQNLKVSLELLERCQVVALTSAEVQEGKTTVAAGLAAAFAREGRKTLLVDADLRRKGLSERCPTNEASWEKIMAGSLQNGADDAVHHRTANLDVLPSDASVENPLEWLADEKCGQLLDWARTHYDKVILDTSASNEFSDASILGRLADSIVLVVRPDRVPREPVAMALERLQSFGCRLTGVVVNRLRSGPRWDRFHGYSRGCSQEPESAAAGNAPIRTARDDEAPRDIEGASMAAEPVGPQYKLAAGRKRDAA